MEGRGVTNYSMDKPSYGFSTATTEFDDALMSRGIVTFEQAMIAKGASPEEARRLADIKFNNAEGNRDDQQSSRNNHEETSDDDDEEFIRSYRQQRIKELQKDKNAVKYGDVMHISRSDWNREVNEASRYGTWVIVNLTRHTSSLSARHDELCDLVEETIRELAMKFEQVKFVFISSTSAIENWPTENLPTLFCYRYGKMQHQLIGIDALGGQGFNCPRLEWRLARLGIVETDLEEDPLPVTNSTGYRSKGSRSKFSIEDYCNDDFDGVD
jgi:hypothetical protein